MATAFTPTLFALTIIGILSSTVTPLRFEMQSGLTKCVTESIKQQAMTVGKYDVVNPHEGHPLPDSHHISVQVTASNGETVHRADNIPSGQFAFVSAEDSVYMMCMWPPVHDPPIKFSVDFEWKSGIAAKEWHNVAKKNSIESMEYELRQLHDVVEGIQEEMLYLRHREEEMRELNDSTNSKMGWLSFMSLFVCMAVASLQFWHLRNFFQKKKLI